MLDREVGKAFMRWAAYTARMRHAVMTLVCIVARAAHFLIIFPHSTIDFDR